LAQANWAPAHPFASAHLPPLPRLACAGRAAAPRGGTGPVERRWQRGRCWQCLPRAQRHRRRIGREGMRWRLLPRLGRACRRTGCRRRRAGSKRRRPSSRPCAAVPRPPSWRQLRRRTGEVWPRRRCGVGFSGQKGPFQIGPAVAAIAMRRLALGPPPGLQRSLRRARLLSRNAPGSRGERHPRSRKSSAATPGASSGGRSRMWSARCGGAESSKSSRSGRGRPAREALVAPRAVLCPASAIRLTSPSA